ncbi:MAG: flagellar hook capping FlgD N-terminal domain-containing protein [Alphaproteobacteria bacterium]
MTDAINPLAAALPKTTTGTTTGNAASQLSGNYTMFLKLLTTQLQNQDPLNPTDATTYTQQLVSYSQVEQQIKTNDNLGSILAATKANANSNVALLNYLGHYVAIDGSKVALQGGVANMTYQLKSGASAVTLDILDSSGAKVATFNGSGGTAVQKVSWDGRNNTGTQLPDGTYTLQITATDSAGNPVDVKSQTMIAKVTGVQRGVDGNTLYLGNTPIDESKVKNVYNSPNDITS